MSRRQSVIGEQRGATGPGDISEGRPLSFFVTAAPAGDDIGARTLLRGVRMVDGLLGKRGGNADWVREVVQVIAVVPFRANLIRRSNPIAAHSRPKAAQGDREIRGAL